MHKHNRNRTNISNKRHKYKLTNKKIAALLGYSTDNSFNKSTAKDRILYAIDAIITLVEENIKDKL